MYNFKVVADGNEDNTNLTYSAVTPDLYSQSNTYSCSEVENDNLLLKYEYDFTAKNGNKVSSDLPQITVLTPGLGGYAYQWGRVAESKALGYFSDSIITKLANVQDSNVYYIDTYSPLIANGEIDFKNANELSGLTYNIYDITAQVYESINNNVEGEPYNLIESIDKISDFTKHSIIIFNGHTVLLENYKAYIEFNYVISSIVKQYKDVKNELPRLNLIGHSRGGLTNLQYTLDHPDLVANLFSIGTPYCGSISAEMDINYHILNPSPSLGEEDIVDPSIYREYMRRWNENYDKLYDSINVHALGGYSSLNLISSILLDEKTDIYNGFAEFLLAMGINTFGHFWAEVNSSELMKNLIIKSISLILENYAQDTNDLSYGEVCGMIGKLLSDIKKSETTGEVVWESDAFVQLASQIGYAGYAPEVAGINNYDEYIGFNRFIKFFDIENSYLDKTAEYDAPILHNLEPRDIDMIDYIIRVLKSEIIDAEYDFKNISNTEVSISQYINKFNLTDIQILDTIEEKTVTKIDRYAFYDLNGVEEIFVPKDVVEIGDYAFAECGDLKRIIFEEGSNLTTLGDFVFYNCNDLEIINLPDSVTSIGKGSFMNCKSLISITLPSGMFVLNEKMFVGCGNLSQINLPSSLMSIKANVFNGCNSLTNLILPATLISFDNELFVSTNISSLSIDGISENFVIYNDGLYDTNKSKLYYYFGNSHNVVLPDETLIIEDYAFYANNYIQTIDLNNTSIIGKYAFCNCVNLQTFINYDNVKQIDFNSIFGTLWFNQRQSSSIVMGEALVLYVGSEGETSLYVPDNIKYIGEFAVTSENLEEVYVPSSVTKIADNAFSLAVNVKDVYILKTTPPIINENSLPMFVENIYVPKDFVNTYEQDGMYHDYLGIIKSKVVKVNFYYSNGEFFRTQQIEYYKTLEELYEFYPENSGMYFVGWSIDSTGDEKIYQNGSLFDIYEDEINMYPIFKGLNVKITLEGMLESSTENVGYGENVVLEAPALDGYTFVGWYSMPNGDGVQYTSSDGIITNWPAVDTEIILYAHYEAVVYTISYSIDGIPYVDTDITQYTIEDIIKLPTPTNFGYRFSGWMNCNEEVSTIYKGTIGNLNLSGSWIGTEYDCTLAGGTIDISEDVKIINLDGLQSNEILFTIKNTATMVTFISSDATKIYNMSIEIENRNADLVINLKNVNFVAPTNKNGITANVGEYTLIINCNGTNSIVGGQGSPTQFENVADGMCGILANRLVLDGSFIAITGGNGNHGVDSIEEDGEVIVNAGNGGHGGYAVYVLSTLNPKLSEMVLTGGAGGNGGNAVNGDAGYAGLGQQACNFDHSYGEKGSTGVPGTSVNGSDGGFNGAEENEMESVTILNLNCHQKVSYDTEIVSKMQTITYNLNIGCLNVYYITISSLAEVTFVIYNSEKEIVFGPVVKISDEKSIIQNISLESGLYTIEVTNNSQTASSITTHVRAAGSNPVSLQLSTRTDAFEHLHNGFNEYIFYSEIGGFYNLELDAYEVVPKNAVSIKYYDTVVEKIANLDIDYYASNIHGASNITFYYPGNVTYFIEINVNKINSNGGTLTSLFLTLDKIDAVESLNEEDDYTKMIEINRGDLIESLVIPTRGLYEIVLEHNLSLTSKVTLIVTKENDESPSGFDIIVLKDINALTPRTSNIFSTDSNTILHFGYLNSYGEGAIEFNIGRLIVNNFTIITDPNGSTGCGSEVRINGGQYNGTDMTVGYTRICYLGTDAPDTSSRLKYDWYSTNPDVAEISSYGTITAISAGTTTIKAIYKDYPAIYGEITIVVSDYGEMSTVYLKYGMDIRTGGTVSGTEVTSGKGNIINVSVSPAVTIHAGYTRLICLGNDSPTSSIQDFTWTSYQEFDTDEGVASVSKYGTITGRYAGSLTIKGVYKYNPNYVVYIRITVI